MRLADLGEDRLLELLLAGIPAGRNLVLGAGDDCAVVRVSGSVLLLKTDCVVEDVHFHRREDPARVGWKALCRPLSDIAAMGGEPLQALVTIVAPSRMPVEYWKDFYRGLKRAARKFQVGIAGGETARSTGGIVVSVALIGRASARRFITRGGGAPGDVLFVTGRLGGSLRGHHLDFVPRLAEGRWLAENFPPKAMMDLSDGLAKDLPRLAAASRCGFELDFAAIPANRGCSLEQALGDGEDYELLFAMAPRKAAGLERAWRRRFPRVPLTRIGRLVRRGVRPALPPGFDHFFSCQKPANPPR